jgi:hypothetical protein
MEAKDYSWEGLKTLWQGILSTFQIDLTFLDVYWLNIEVNTYDGQDIWKYILGFYLCEIVLTYFLFFRVYFLGI